MSVHAPAIGGGAAHQRSQSLHNYGHLYDPDFQNVLMASCVLAFEHALRGSSVVPGLHRVAREDVERGDTGRDADAQDEHVAFDPLNFLGILLGFAGSVSYAYVKLVR